MSNVEAADLQFRSKAKKPSRSSFSRTRSAKAPIGIPIPDVTPLNPPLGLVPPLPPKIEHLDDTGASVAAVGADEGPGLRRRSTATRCSAAGTLDVARYGRLLKSRQLVGVRGAGLPYDGLYYVKSVSHDIQRGAYKQSFHARAQRADLDRCRRCRHEQRPLPRQVPRARSQNNIDPLTASAASG